MARHARQVQQHQFREPEARLDPLPCAAQPLHPVTRLEDLRWLNTEQACAYLAFTGTDRLHSLYRWLDAQGVRRFYRSPRRVVVLRTDLDDALRRPYAVRRRNRMRLVAGQ